MKCLQVLYKLVTFLANYHNNYDAAYRLLLSMHSTSVTPQPQHKSEP